jgi:stage II sporulation protein D
MVRVLVGENRPRIDLRAIESPTVHLASGQTQRLALSGGAPADVVFDGTSWKIGDADFGAGEVLVEPTGEGTVSIAGQSHRGKYRFIPKPGGRFDVINEVDVEGYLMGVLSKEMLWNWQDEAYRAQAIVARTYALYVARTSSQGSNFDLFADTRSQVYGGIAGETSRSRSAVEATLGKVVAYGPAGQERIFKAYFSSCCGGITQSAAAAFGDPPCEALSEQNIGTRCSASPKFTWPTVTLQRSEITRRLRIWGANNNAPEKTIGDVARIDVLTNNHYGRPASFTVTDTRGYRYRLGCEDLRLGVNTDAGEGPRLPSSFCRPINEGATIKFADGHGLGHGVGLCQYCAQQQASAGVGHTEIVLDAYPKSVIVSAY